MKKNLYFTGLMASFFLFSADNTVQVTWQIERATALQWTPDNADTARNRPYVIKYSAKMGFYSKLTKALTKHGVLPPGTLAREHKRGYHQIFTRDQQVALRQTFDEQDDAVKTTIAHELTIDQATLVQRLQEYQSPLSVPKDLAKRAKHKKYRDKANFFSKFAIQLTQRGILLPNTIVLERRGSHVKPLTRKQHAILLQAFRECQNIEIKDAIAQELSKAHAPLVEQLLGVTIPPPENFDFTTLDALSAWNNFPLHQLDTETSL